MLLFFESQIKLLENSYIGDSIVCIVRKKFDNKLTNSPYVSLLCDITTYILVAKKLGVYLKSEFLWPTYIQHGPHFLLPMDPWAPSFQKLGRTLQKFGLVLSLLLC